MNGVDDRIARMIGGWFRNSYGVIVNGVGWEISRDSDHTSDEFGTWSLWHHGEYVGNYATVEDAKADAYPVDCSKCAGLTAPSDLCPSCGSEDVSSPDRYGVADCHTCGEQITGSEGR